MLAAKIVLKSDKITQTLQNALKEIQGGPIEGALTLPASEFKYWWYLEFGTATRYAGGDTLGLRRPRGIASVQGTSSWYPIAARRKKLLVFMHYGHLVRAKVVTHPGIRPANAGKGIVRVAIRRMQLDIAKDLRALIKERKGRMPTRRMLVALVNKRLKEMLASIRRRTPIDPDSTHSEHLRNAWDIRPAE